MRKLPIPVGAVAILALSVAWAPCSYGQAEKSSSGREGQKHSRKEGRGEQSTHAKTIHGVIAGITAEGEIVFDYRHNKAIEAEAAFLTVVGSPKKSDEGGREHAAKSTQGEKAEHHHGRRDNVYIVWLSPKTKVCKCTEGSKEGRQESAAGSGKSEKKECSIDQLEVGDHVDIVFTPREESGDHQVAHQSEKIRQKHGRHRTHVGYATEVTIHEPADDGHSGSKDEKSSSR